MMWGLIECKTLVGRHDRLAVELFRYVYVVILMIKLQHFLSVHVLEKRTCIICVINSLPVESADGVAACRVSW